MPITEITSPADQLETSSNKVHGWCILITKIKNPADRLETSPSPNSDVIQFS